MTERVPHVLHRSTGRFAPSPTGPLHFGSLVAALGSYLSARSRGGAWRVRIDDLDPPREVPGSSDAILHALERHGLHWDGPILYQSRREIAYADALDRLATAGLVYRCSCSRREVAAAAAPGIGGPIYPGWCRDGPRARGRPLAWRLRVPETRLGFVDAACGHREANLADAFGDIVVRRADGLFAYHLATVVDDAHLGITEVVRGADLLDLTLPQAHLGTLLDFPTPVYLHLPLVTGDDGAKLSKQNGAAALPEDDPRPALCAALKHLGQCPDRTLRDTERDDILDWARAHWHPERIPGASAALPT